MALRIGSDAPDFSAETTEGRIRFHDWVGDSWCVMFSHPKDFTPVCTTELGFMAGLKPEFDKRNCKILGLSVDPVEDHKRWSLDIKEATGHAPNYRMIGDSDLAVAKTYEMLPDDAGTTAQGRSFHAQAVEAEQRGDLRGAISSLQLALTFEPGNQYFKKKLQELKQSAA